MVELGGSVLATDFSEGMLERARARGGDIEYRRVDATDEDALLALGDPGSFDAVVSNMAIMDMTSIEPMASAAARLLKPGGRFVLSTLHPAFNSGEAVPTAELVYRDGDVRKVYSVKVSSYAKPSSAKGWRSRDSPSSSGTSTGRCRTSSDRSSITASCSTGSRSRWWIPSAGRPDPPATCSRRCREFSSSGSARPRRWRGASENRPPPDPCARSHRIEHGDGCHVRLVSGGTAHPSTLAVPCGRELPPNGRRER